MPIHIAGHRARIDLITAAYERHQSALLGFVYDRLDVLDHHRGEDIVAAVWRRISASTDRVDERVLDLDWLQTIARAVLREQTSPTRHQVLYLSQERPAALREAASSTPAALSIAA